MKTVTLTHKHLDVKPLVMQLDTFLTMIVESLDNYDVEYNN